jgi:hypothetical protein
MKQIRLNTLYHRLTPWERIPLLIAAQDRGDETEHQRLLATSPLRSWRFSEHLLAEEALHILALIYIGEQLDAAANYFFANVQMFVADEARAQADWQLMADGNAYFFTANTQAWSRFCAELHTAPDALLAVNHQGWFLGYCQEHMPASAPSPEALQTRLSQQGRQRGTLVTADALFASWQKALRAMTRHAPPEFVEEEQ